MCPCLTSYLNIRHIIKCIPSRWLKRHYYERRILRYLFLFGTGDVDEKWLLLFLDACYVSVISAYSNGDCDTSTGVASIKIMIFNV